MKRGCETREIRVRADCSTRTRPRAHQPAQNGCAVQKSLFTRRSATSVILSSRYNLKSQHNATSTARAVLDVASILGLTVDGDVHLEAMLNPRASLSVPSTDGLVHAQKIAWLEAGGAMFVEGVDEVLNESPASLRPRSVIVTDPMLTERQTLLYIVEAVARNSRLASKRRRVEMLRRRRR